MIDHHAMAVQMAEVCLDKAVHPELAGMCEDIRTSQSQEMVDMQSWLRDWYGTTHEPDTKPGQMRQIERLVSLSGSEFEMQFMESMISTIARRSVTARPASGGHTTTNSLGFART